MGPGPPPAGGGTAPESRRRSRPPRSHPAVPSPLFPGRDLLRPRSPAPGEPTASGVRVGPRLSGDRFPLPSPRRSRLCLAFPLPPAQHSGTQRPRARMGPSWVPTAEASSPHPLGHRRDGASLWQRVHRQRRCGTHTPFHGCGISEATEHGPASGSASKPRAAERGVTGSGGPGSISPPHSQAGCSARSSRAIPCAAPSDTVSGPLRPLGLTTRPTALP